MGTLALALICLTGFQASADLGTDMAHDIGAWKVGQRPPARLLKFPDGNLPVGQECGLEALSRSVGLYFMGITNAELLTAVMFDPQVEADSFRAAARQLTMLKGVRQVARVVADQRKASPDAYVRSELAVLTELLRSPYLAIQVARIAPEDMPPNEAETVLRHMRTELEAGKTWIDAYRRCADLHPDPRDRAQDPRSTRTLVSYLYDTTVSPGGFDILDYRTAESLPLEHLRELFRAKHGTHILRAAGGVYLYHIGNYYDGAP
jgi:hypothetical protein